MLIASEAMAVVTTPATATLIGASWFAAVVANPMTFASLCVVVSFTLFAFATSTITTCPAAIADPRAVIGTMTVAEFVAVPAKVE